MFRQAVYACVLSMPFGVSMATGQEKLPPLPPGLVAPATVVDTAGTACFLEGPAVDGKGNVFFSDIAGNRILKMDPKGKIDVWRADSGRTNGNAFDAHGRLISCEGNEQGEGRRRIVRTDMKTGKITVLTDKYHGKRYNSPNDVCVDSRGRVWFTDPYYGPHRDQMEMDIEGVYRIDPVSPPTPFPKGKRSPKVFHVLTQKEVQRPNGIAVSPDDKTLYVVDSHPKPGGNRKVWGFDIATDGSLSKRRLIYDFGKGRGGDGMRLDVKGNLWVAAGISVKRGPGETLDNPPGVYVISPKGKLLGVIPIPENLITNLAFGGPQRKTLYVTAGKTVYRFSTLVSGHALNLK
ncbi:MAG: SMP-30/gluconolactonase/LRE family protein [Planctomycetes bacterium]|nr:SMP-30/gluconolactonase/LRE family protein [Planctomycetota bacterium]